MPDNVHVAEEHYETLWARCEPTLTHARTDVGILALPDGSVLVLHRQPGAWNAVLFTAAGDVRMPRLAMLQRLAEHE